MTLHFPSLSKVSISHASSQMKPILGLHGLWSKETHSQSNCRRKLILGLHGLQSEETQPQSKLMKETHPWLAWYSTPLTMISILALLPPYVSTNLHILIPCSSKLGQFSNSFSYATFFNKKHDEECFDWPQRYLIPCTQTFCYVVSIYASLQVMY